MTSDKLDILSATERFYKLPKDDRYRVLDGNPDSVGGHSTGTTQVSWSVASAVRESFPINAVPAELAALVAKYQKLCLDAEQVFDEILGALVDHIQDDVDARWSRKDREIQMTQDNTDNTQNPA